MKYLSPTKQTILAIVFVAFLSPIIIGYANRNDFSGEVFSAPLEFDTGPMPWLLKLGDLNGDNRPDVVTANILQFGSTGISVFLNKTQNAENFELGERKDFAAGSLTGGIALADFNEDGLPDIATANSGGISNDISILINETPKGSETAVFKSPLFFKAGWITHLIVAGDLNADGKPDLVTGNSGTLGGGAVSVLLNSSEAGASKPDFTLATQYDGGAIAEGLVLGDINGDGSLDIIEGNTLSSTVTILLNKTTTGSLTPDFIGPITIHVNFATAVDLGDFNRDGRLDVVAASTLGGTYVLFNETKLGSDEVVFSEPVYFYSGGDVTEGVVVADFDGDGVLDYATNNNNIFSFLRSDGVAIFYNRTPAGERSPVFEGPFTYPPSPGANSIDAADLNGDGLPDLAVGIVDPFGTDGLSILLNALVQ